MRLVDADAARIYLNAPACEQIKQMPTIDPIHAAGGCYCRECRYHRYDEEFDKHYCNEPMGNYGSMAVRPDDFCSYGKTKE